MAWPMNVKPSVDPSDLSQPNVADSKVPYLRIAGTTQGAGLIFTSTKHPPAEGETRPHPRAAATVVTQAASSEATVHAPAASSALQPASHTPSTVARKSISPSDSSGPPGAAAK